jgi:hypothetical protein
MMELSNPPTNAEWLLAKVGQRRSETKRSLAMLPTVEDLPADGWKVLGQRTWRTGKLGLRSEVRSRAAAIGAVTAWRSFENGNRTRWIWAQINPLASHDDALVALGEASEQGMRNPKAKVTLTAEMQVEAPAVPGIETSWALEQHTSGSRGQHVGRVYGACVGRIIFTLAASGWMDWSWTEVAEVAGVIGGRAASLDP